MCIYAYFIIIIKFYYDADFIRIDDIREVQDFFWDIRAAWKTIGLELGIDMGTLDSIERTHRMVAEDCLLEMLKRWLQHVTPKPTRSVMASVLQSKPLAGLSTTAGELYHQHLYIDVTV